MTLLALKALTSSTSCVPQTAVTLRYARRIERSFDHLT